MAGNSIEQKKYKAFVAGTLSGTTKLVVGHPFDTLKVRLQTTPKSHFSGPVQCLLQTIRKEGIVGLYKGATPPLVGWVFMDSVLMGSLTFYRSLLLRTLFPPKQPTSNSTSNFNSRPSHNLPPMGHGLAGLLAGITVSTVAAPIEHIKARLQIQYSNTQRLYSGPLDCIRKIYTHHGIAGIYHGLTATLIFRASFFFWWSSYDLLSTQMLTHTSLSPSMVNFWAGGLSAQVFWCMSYPCDVIKQRIMTDPLGGSLRDGNPRWVGWGNGWMKSAKAVMKESGWKGYWRGFLPCFMRAFPANAMAMVVFESVLRSWP
ncbi:Mitochondrial substrate carrier family protein L [Golovinomyces cichoracearum]|uniref:Mitochondrial substrate carrier family protein L n=1 Tax=Golovinomyces cichoracearum TaxID=62708 RepID=A0A420IPF1_9PEZI|nr:Mitochondrial substrate carrier family protein L [Golovinomyces cichoracearum]